MKHHVLFVDDEPRLLHGLRRMLRPLRHEWDMSFAQSGAEALEILERQPTDVIVSDMRMPEMNGVTLLSKVKERWPHIIRIVLSGQSEAAEIIRSVGVVHQFLAKPCDPEMLKLVVTRACHLRELLNSDAIARVISGMDALPALPTIYFEVMEEIRKPDGTIRRVGEIISRDLGMSAKVLQLVNSAFFGHPRRLTSVPQAASLLGLDTLRGLMMAGNVFRRFDARKLEGFDPERLWRHSVEVGALAGRIASAETDSREIVDYAVMGGLLHDLGKLLLAANLPEEYGRALELKKDKRIDLWQAEAEAFGCTHAEVGAYLLDIWGMPDTLVEAVALHHRPHDSRLKQFGPLTAVHVANHLHHELNKTTEMNLKAALDMTYMSEIGLEDKIGDWEQTEVEKEESAA